MRGLGCSGVVLLLVCAIAVRTGAALELRSSIRLTDQTVESGITFQHSNGGSGQNYIVEFMTAGLAILDYDGDGWSDVYFLNGAPLRGTVFDTRPHNVLYRNNGNGTFSDVTLAAGVGDSGFGLGVVAGDLDNDGDQDLFINNFGENILYRNNGDGTFSDVSHSAGIGHEHMVGGGACFLDSDNDGDLDLYVGNYVDFSYDGEANAEAKRREFFSGPTDYTPLADNMFRNNGDGTFTDVSVSSGIGLVKGTTMGMISFDYEEDGDSDLFICNDAMQNFLFQNIGDGRFLERGLMAGLAYNFRGDGNGSMGVDCGDYNADGLLDLFMTNYMREMPVIYCNLGAGMFEDQTRIAGIGGRALPETTWGTSLGDFDNDGDCDIFMACGDIFTGVRASRDAVDHRAANIVLANRGNGTFADVTRQGGSGMRVRECSRGVVFNDLDNDGDLDAAILNSNAPATILRNDSPGHGNWLQIRLRGVRRTREGIGARIKVFSGDKKLTVEMHCGRGYQSHSASVSHFGLGAEERIDRIEVYWLGGDRETFYNVPINQRVILTEGTGQ